MDKLATLAEVIERAAERNNGASGRRLADIAHRDGFTLSHATINRLRRGEVGVITQATVDALAHLAAYPAADIRAIALDETGTAQSAEGLAREYARLDAEVLRIVLDYANARDIDLPEAKNELDEIRVMAFQSKEGRPWTPPWKPLNDDFAPGDTPWREKWWNSPAAAEYQRRRDINMRDRLNGETTPAERAKAADSLTPTEDAGSRVDIAHTAADDYGLAARDVGKSEGRRLREEQDRAAEEN